MANLTTGEMKQSRCLAAQPSIVLQWETPDFKERLVQPEPTELNVYTYGKEPKREMWRPQGMLIGTPRKSAEWLQRPEAFKRYFSNYTKVAVVDEAAPKLMCYLVHMNVTHFISSHNSYDEMWDKIQKSFQYSSYVDECLQHEILEMV
ncbi:hypothetical protein [Salsuginibacillus kocurii]|uniref:hypothetical protein n=1 Tax=Salsuginibacillus kocurii TaxID=427078 RepID=UPI000361770D|nr:hypothetical protein [Salsuginibacillus kocurii]